MSEDAYFPLEKWKLFSKPATKERLLLAAIDAGGMIQLVRFDRETGETVTDIITADMPSDEIIL